MAEKDLSSEQKVTVVLVGPASQMPKIKAYLEAVMAASSGNINVLNPQKKTAQEVLADLKASEVFDESHLEKNIICMTETNLRQLQQILSERVCLPKFELQISHLNENLDYAFAGQEEKPQYYVPKKIGMESTRAKGAFRQRHFVITRPWLMR